MSIRPLPTEDSSSCSRVYDENSSTTQLSLAEDSTSSPGPLVDNSPSAHLALAPDRIGLDRKGKEDIREVCETSPLSVSENNFKDMDIKNKKAPLVVALSGIKKELKLEHYKADTYFRTDESVIALPLSFL